MKTLRILLLVALGVAAPVSAGSTDGWVNTWGSKLVDTATDVAVDHDGYVYVTGGVEVLPGNVDVFLAKLEPGAGELVWQVSWGDTAADRGEGILVHDGTILVVGAFQGSGVDFDPGAEKVNRSSHGSADAFLARYTTEGEFIAANTWGGPGGETANDVSVDSAGNVYVVGSFGGASSDRSADFDPGPGTAIEVSNGGYDAYVSCFDAAGALQWVRTWGGNYFDMCATVANDALGNVYVAGSVLRDVDLDPGPAELFLAAYGSSDCYLSKLDDQGNLVWSRRWGGNRIDKARDVAVDAGGMVHVVGSFGDRVDFDPGPGVDFHATTARYSAYVSKFDGDGGFQWAKTWSEGSTSIRGKGVAVDDAGNVYAIGTVTGGAAPSTKGPLRGRQLVPVVDFDPGEGTALRSHTHMNFFLSKFDRDGVFEWVRTTSALGAGPSAQREVHGAAVALDAHGNPHAAGWFVGRVDFAPRESTCDAGPAYRSSSLLLFDSFVVNYRADGCWTTEIATPARVNPRRVIRAKGKLR